MTNFLEQSFMNFSPAIYLLLCNKVRFINRNLKRTRHQIRIIPIVLQIAIKIYIFILEGFTRLRIVGSNWIKNLYALVSQRKSIPKFSKIDEKSSQNNIDSRATEARLLQHLSELTDYQNNWKTEHLLRSSSTPRISVLILAEKQFKRTIFNVVSTGPFRMKRGVKEVLHLVIKFVLSKLHNINCLHWKGSHRWLRDVSSKEIRR